MYCNSEAKKMASSVLADVIFTRTPSHQIHQDLEPFIPCISHRMFFGNDFSLSKEVTHTEKPKPKLFFFSKAKALLKGPLVWPTLHPYIKARLFLRRHPIRCCGTVNACAEPGCRRADNHSDRIDPSCAHACIDSNYPAFSPFISLKPRW